MMDYPLLLTNFMQHAAKYYPAKEISLRLRDRHFPLYLCRLV